VVNSLQEAASEEGDKQTDAFRDEVLARLEQIERRLPLPVLPASVLPEAPAPAAAPPAEAAAPPAAAPLTHP
jgi:hypothetical protein